MKQRFSFVIGQESEIDYGLVVSHQAALSNVDTLGSRFFSIEHHLFELNEHPRFVLQRTSLSKCGLLMNRIV